MVVGTVGRLAPQKAPEHMLEAFRRLDRPGLFFVWIGGGPLSRKLEQLVARAGLVGRFRFAGERRDVNELLPGLDVFAMSSLYEGLPCSIAEAMAAGVPVVATAVNAVPELVIPGQTGILVPPAAPALLARAIEYLVESPGEGQRMAAAAMARVGDAFGPHQLGRELHETYRLMLPERTEQLASAVQEVTVR
jgi:glycosyltransferase involved in cell wall biosynthesis